MNRKSNVLCILFVLFGFIFLVPDVRAGTLADDFLEILKRNDLTKIELSNGLSVVLLENHAAPVVAFQMWVNVGSRYEEDEQAGISHVFEHMLFKGTARRGVGEIAREVETAGGNINAFTSFDHTVYHLSLASRYFDVGLDVIADAIQNSSFDPEELARESGVVLEELKRAEDNPGRVVTTKLFERAYEVHPYGRPVIGYEETFMSLTREHYLDYFRKWYVPNNMSLVVVGDFQTGHVIPKIVQAFDGFAPALNLSKEIPPEPEQNGIRTIVTRKEANHTFLNLGYHIPGIHDPQNPVWDLLGMILGQGETSRLYKNVKRDKELVHTISAYAYTPVDPGVLFIDTRLDSEQIEKALEEILRQVQSLTLAPVSEEELYRARINLESEFIYSKQTMEGQANKLGYYEADFGDPLHAEAYLKGLSSATPQQIMQLARDYLRTENLTVSLLLSPDQKPDLENDRLRNMVQKISRLIEKESSSNASKTTGLPHKATLSNGIRVIVKENHAVPTVAVKIAFPGGQRYEGDETSGVFHFISSMLDRGTEKRTAEEISAEIEDMAGSVRGFSGRNSFGAELTILSRHYMRGMNILSDLVLNPSFDPEEMEKVRKDILAAIQQEEDNLFRRTANLFRKTLYITHPYRLRLTGEESTVKGFTHEDLERIYHQSISPEQMVIAVVGDVKVSQAIAAVEELFGKMKKRPVIKPDITQEMPQGEIREKADHVERRQAHMIMGFLGTTVTSKDRYALEVMNNVLAGQGGRLFAELRDKKGLAYAVTSFSQQGVDPGFLAAYIGCSPEKLNDAKQGIIAELRKIQDKKVSSAEMERSKKNLIGSFDIALQTNDSMASAMIFDELYGNGYDAYQEYAKSIEKVSAKDIQRIAKKYIDLMKYSLAVVKPMAEVHEGNK